MKDEHWSQLDNTVYIKLHIENIIIERAHFLSIILVVIIYDDDVGPQHWHQLASIKGDNKDNF